MIKKLKKYEFLIVLLCMFFIVTLAVLANFLWRESRQFVESSIEQRFQVLHQEFQSEMTQVVLSARSLVMQESKSVLIGEALVNPKAKDYLVSHWSALFEVYPELQQIRYISVSGDEKIRAELKNKNLIWVPDNSLQNKSNRYYFIEAMSTDKEYYLSPLDLNKENGVVEIPFRPTIRSVAKYRVNGKLEGLIVVNFDLRKVFSNLNAFQGETSHWLINPDGFFISSPNNTAWGWLLDRHENQVRTYFPGLKIDSSHSDSLIPNKKFIESYKYSDIPIHKPDFLDTDFDEPYYWLVMEKPSELIGYLNKSYIFIVAGFLVFTTLMLGLTYFLIVLIKQLNLEKNQAIEAKNKAKIAEQVKADFLARMSHEIRTPMNGVYGLLQVTQGERDYKKINSNLDQAITSFSLLSRIIDDVLDFSKIEAGKLEIVESPFQLDTLLKQIGQMMGRAAYGKSIELWIDIDPNCPKQVIGDAVRLNQIISNLISNSIKFTTRGEVNLRVELLTETSNFVQMGFEVQDSGIGMTDEQSSKIFEAFTQATRETNSKFGGTGLGLSIAKQLVELMDGKIGVISEKGVGSTFHFNVKLKKVKENNGDIETKKQQDFASYQAVILTQNVNAEFIIKRQCSVLGWPSFLSRSIDELSKNTLSDTLPKVLLIDEAILSNVDEDSLLSWQKSQVNIVHLLIVSHNRKGAGETLTILCDELLTKPFTPSTLYDAVISCSDTGEEDVSKSIQDQSHLFSDKLILVVEDNPINQQVAGAMLQSVGAAVKFSENGQECLDLLQSGVKPHLILMDMQMPVMDGIEATKLIRKNQKWDEIPIYAMTANAMESDKRICLDAGMQGHISKPVDKQALIDLIKSKLLFS